METIQRRHTATLTAEALVIAYMGIIALAAHITGINLLLFPELAALSHDVMTRPGGKWASQPWRLILTPTMTAIVGLFITRHASYGAVASAVIALLALAVIKLLRSAIGPAISAGVLPMVLGEKSWLYPVSICAGLVGLVVLLLAFKRWGPRVEASSGSSARHSEVVDALEAYPHSRFWVLSLLAFVLVLGAAAQITGLRFILFPPLVVMAYEIFGHPEVPGWMACPIFFPIVCFLTALIGVLADQAFQASSLAVMLTTLCSIAVLRAFRVHMPPALAVGLLPFVMTAPNIWYPVSVGIGTVVLVLCFWARRSFQRSYATVAAEEA
ncbi:HPP family protein [Acidicapsa acidisoli]|uniref:HPP family protein n=1 Tax=Acidicapsa acidisoli TaxID=1615681 RepID=UPI0021E0BA3A|nr:HPP family protein [Acidicapsa acidisoli]